jgi:hypothetical protein
MRFSTISAVLAFAASTYAQTAGFDPITAPTQDQNVAAGSTLDIVWEPSANYTGTVSITLLEGATPSTLTLGNVVKAGIENSVGKFSWAIPSDIATFATYGFKITLDSDTTIFQYSFPFHITGTSTSSSSYSGSMTSASTKTMTLSTGTAYTPTSSALSSSTSSANLTSSVIKTASYNATTMSTASSIKPTGNSSTTYAVSTTTGSGSSASKTGSSATTTSSGPAAATTNAAVANIASGSMALFGGLVIAFAL